jgi:peptidyl-tRNA hydrolase
VTDDPQERPRGVVDDPQERPRGVTDDPRSSPHAAADDPMRMFLVLRRGAIESLSRAAELGGAAAVACVREFAEAPEMAQWRRRPGKVCLRARNPSQWEQVLREPHTLAGDPEGEAVVALPPRRRSERGPVLERLQAMSSELEAPPLVDDPRADPDRVVYVANPKFPMSSGKTVAQVAHAAVLAADTGALEDWVARGCQATLVATGEDAFERLCRRDDLAARVVDAGLTEVPPGTVTVLALAPHPS